MAKRSGKVEKSERSWVRWKIKPLKRRYAEVRVSTRKTIFRSQQRSIMRLQKN